MAISAQLCQGQGVPHRAQHVRRRPRPVSNATGRPTPGVFGDWAKSRHANANITCLDCHLAQPGDQDIAQGHEKYYGRSDLPWGEAKYKMPIASIVTPKDCSRCHPDEATQYSKSKHANTIEIMWKLDPWLNKGMNSDNERKTGCLTATGP
jgi:hydroxylamine dehydrogenase